MKSIATGNASANHFFHDILRAIEIQVSIINRNCIWRGVARPVRDQINDSLTRHILEAIRERE